MKRALHSAACVAAYARLVFCLAIGWSVLPFQANEAGPKIRFLIRAQSMCA